MWRAAGAVNRKGASSNPTRGAKLFLLRELSAFWFYKKGCQEKKLPREMEAAKSFGIQPLCRCAGASRRSSACVVSPVKWRDVRCRVIKFLNSPFPLMRNGFCRTARSGQGRAVSARRSGPLTVRAVLQTVYEEGKEVRRLDRFLKQQARRLQVHVATIVLSETRGL